MSAEDRLRWDGAYAERAPADLDTAVPPQVFADVADDFPMHGQALELACGRGGAAVWLARRGLVVRAVDVSPVAIGQARELAEQWQVGDRCRFDVADLDQGLPPGPVADLILCHRFWAPALAGAIVERLAPRGLLAIAVLSEVGAAPGRYRAAEGDLDRAFAPLDPIASGEGQGIAWMLARKA